MVRNYLKYTITGSFDTFGIHIPFLSFFFTYLRFTRSGTGSGIFSIKTDNNLWTVKNRQTDHFSICPDFVKID
jgi:hypothetical protein